MNFYGMKKKGDCIVKEYPGGGRLIIPQEEVISISLYILQGANNGALKKKVKPRKR
jgi:hypothetical protein